MSPYVKRDQRYWGAIRARGPRYMADRRKYIPLPPGLSSMWFVRIGGLPDIRIGGPR